MKALCLLLLTCLLTGCYSTREFNVSYNQKNKEIVRTVFTKGNTSCEMNFCYQIISKDSTINTYQFYGAKGLGIKAKLKAKSKNDNNTVVLKIKITNIAGGRIKETETRMLNEIGYELKKQNP